jgi:hypothetical protein
MTAAVTFTGIVTDPWLVEFPYHARYNFSPVLLSASMPIPIERVMLVPLLGFTAPTRGTFGVDPIVRLQPQLRFRADVGAFVFGLGAFIDAPLVTTWNPQNANYDFGALRCHPGETRCRRPVTRERLRTGLLSQGEFWVRPDLSIALTAGIEFRDELWPVLVNHSNAPDGSIPGYPEFKHLEFRARVFVNWAFSRHFGLTAAGGAISAERTGPILLTSWDASLSIWLRTDERLNRLWLDH